MWGLFSLVYETITAHWANICLDICLVLSLGRQYASLILGGGSLGCHVMRSGWALSRSSSTLTRAASKKNCQVQTKVVVKCLGWPVATCCSGMLTVMGSYKLCYFLTCDLAGSCSTSATSPLLLLSVILRCLSSLTFLLFLHLSFLSTRESFQSQDLAAHSLNSLGNSAAASLDS